MSTKDILETLSAARLQSELTKKVAARLAPARSGNHTPPKTQGSLTIAKRGSHVASNEDKDVVIGGEHFRLQSKESRLSGKELLEAVHAAIGELLGRGTQVFILHPSDPTTTQVISAVVEQLPAIVRSRRQALSERNIEALVDVYLGGDPLAAARPDLERDNAEAQARFLKKWPVLTAEDVASQAEHTSANRSATASRWKGARRIFGMRATGREVYPTFQFQDGRPRPVIGKVLKLLPETMSGWQTAFWFVGPNGWLDDQAPVDRLSDEAALLAAAEHERDAWMG